MSGKILGHISDSASPDLNLLLDNIDIVRSGLIVHYDMMNTDSYPRAGSFVNDLTGLGHTGSLGSGGYSFSSDGGISFDGITGKLIYNFNIPTAMTHIIFAKSNQVTWNEYATLGANRGANGFSIHPWIGTTDVSFGVMGNDGISQPFVTVTPSVSITTPHLYGITTDGISNSFAYIDTTEYTMSTVPAFVRDATSINVDNHIANDDVPYDTSRFGDITVYVHLFYNRQLSKAEMIQNYNAIKTYA